MKRKLICVLLALALAAGASGCTKEPAHPSVTSETLNVRKVENLPGDFLFGMDASSVIALEESGVVFRDFAGEETDVFRVLAENGVNLIRVRVWNDPYDAAGHGYGGGNSDIGKAVAIGKRATENGMSLLVDFHYSDFWADPSKQMVPKAWKGMSADEKADALYAFTKESLETLNRAGVSVGMVQLGNETNGAMAGETRWANVCKLMASGAKAVREVCPKALIAAHFTNPEKADNLLDYAFRLDYYSIDYDVFGTSYYPYWHGTFDNLAEVLSAVSEKYGKKVMVMETSYAFTDEDTDFWGNTIGSGGSDTKPYPLTVAGQANFLRDLTDTLVNRTENVIGLCYWEGTWISVGTESLEANRTLWETYGSGWASSYAKEYDPGDAGKWYGGSAVDNQAFFDAKGNPLESLKVFALMKNGNDAPVYVDGVLDVVDSMRTDDRTYALPKTVTAVYSDNTTASADVTWEPFDLEQAREAGNGTYDIRGKADGYDVNLRLLVSEYNFVRNDSFEDTGLAPWTLTVNAGKQSDTHKIGITSENPEIGMYAFHFWTSDASGVDFDITQDLELSAGGTYKYTFSVLGGGLGTASVTAEKEDVYGYVLADGAEIARVPVRITNYSDGYREYRTDGIRCEAGKTVTVGIHVGIREANCWGDIDRVMFNYTGE